ncbi:uncharacterized protein BT62DRAFT_643527 [Guyanagaster necrorhizus]|uniref:Uncharacterized protein n=1 Tax=Guyanagaster necrorhizus TaxID=856835 RepID=A0A9P7VG54_9AGAR|nr:uncharacterized protein BT62DRAFT_643527 [Guyanagaster necrorhizus MCA 3950]KAG7440079.1 hypothetical protein BT62DRAFT_643527 [Guyanagaster necrorhizus MCA 3950]
MVNMNEFLTSTWRTVCGLLAQVSPLNDTSLFLFIPPPPRRRWGVSDRHPVLDAARQYRLKPRVLFRVHWGSFSSLPPPTLYISSFRLSMWMAVHNTKWSRRVVAILLLLLLLGSAIG